MCPVQSVTYVSGRLLRTLSISFLPPGGHISGTLNTPLPLRLPFSVFDLTGNDDLHLPLFAPHASTVPKTIGGVRKERAILRRSSLGDQRGGRLTCAKNSDHADKDSGRYPFPHGPIAPLRLSLHIASRSPISVEQKQRTYRFTSLIGRVKIPHRTKILPAGSASQFPSMAGVYCCFYFFRVFPRVSPRNSRSSTRCRRSTIPRRKSL